MARFLVGLILAAAFVLAQTAFTIGEWEQGIIIQFGDHKRTLQKPGLHFKWPMIQTLVRFEKRVLTTDARMAEYLTLDKKRVLVNHVSRWRIQEPLGFYSSVRGKSVRGRIGNGK